MVGPLVVPVEPKCEVRYRRAKRLSTVNSFHSREATAAPGGLGLDGCGSEQVAAASPAEMVLARRVGRRCIDPT
jgi:hypothetical protein